MFKKDIVVSEVMNKMCKFLTEEQLEILNFQLEKSIDDANYEPECTDVCISDDEEIVKKFVMCKKLEGLSLNTLKTYSYSIKKMMEYLCVDLRSITSQDIREYISYCSERMQKITVDNIRRNLNTFFYWMQSEGIIDNNPVDKVKKIKSEKKVKKPVTAIDIQKVRDICTNARDIALIDLLRSTGLRCEEVTKIKLTDINFETKTILIYGKGAKQREVYMDDISKYHIQMYLDKRMIYSDYLFCNKSGNKYSKEGISYIVRELGKKAGVKDFQIHRIRKYFATSLVNRGCDVVYVQNLLGHSKLDTTMIYVQTTSEKTHLEFNRFIA